MVFLDKVDVLAMQFDPVASTNLANNWRRGLLAPSLQGGGHGQSQGSRHAPLHSHLNLLQLALFEVFRNGYPVDKGFSSGFDTLRGVSLPPFRSGQETSFFPQLFRVS